MKEAKFLEMQSNKQTRVRKSKRTGSRPNVTADNLTLDEATDGLQADAATDSTAEESTCNSKGSSKQKSSGTATTLNVKRSKHSADDKIDVNRCCVCFEMYADDAGTGREWLECQCSKCIHEDCIDDDEVDTEKCIFVHFVKTGRAEMVRLLWFWPDRFFSR